jgi:ribonucleoside-triphosphate reductase
MTVTHDHIFPLLIDDEYHDVEAKYLKVGDKLAADDAQWNLLNDDKENIINVEIASIEHIEDKTDVYCIQLENEDSPYFVLANGIITHNCRLKNKIQTREFSFTNGNIGVETGSISVITLNLNRITQDFCKKEFKGRANFTEFTEENKDNFRKYLTRILDRVYKYHNAYNELLWDMYNADLLPVYKAGFIDLNKQYLTIGLNGLNQAAEFLGLECHKNQPYSDFCRFIFGTVKTENERHKTKKTIFNTEQVPAESLAIKNYNCDKADGYWVPEDTNLYASYVFKPNSDDSMLDKMFMMSTHFATDMLDGGSSGHLNSSEHLSKEQYMKLLNYAGEVGCSYWTINVMTII